jgi:cell division topological specificity factor
MSFLKFWVSKEEKGSANTAKDRLQIIIARERSTVQEYDFLPAMELEILEVIKKYIKVTSEDVKISKNRSGEIDVLDVNVTLPAVAG